jgi:hypothetical protein
LCYYASVVKVQLYTLRVYGTYQYIGVITSALSNFMFGGSRKGYIFLERDGKEGLASVPGLGASRGILEWCLDGFLGSFGVAYAGF